MAKAKLTAKEKKLVMQSAKEHIASLLCDDWGEPFKHRNLPDELFDDTDDWGSGSDYDLKEQAADDYFFVCVTQVAKKLRKEARGK